MREALPELKVPDHRVLATDKVYFVGHPIAAVVAKDRYAARDAVDLVMVDYEDLPVVTDVEQAAAGGPVIHEAFGDNIAYKLTSGEGDIDAAFAAAERTVKQRILHKRLAPIAMEPRGVLARYFPGEEELTIWSSTQIPHLAHASRAHDRNSRKQVARDHAGSRRRLRIEVERLRRRSVARLDLDATRQTREMDRNATREYAGDDSRSWSGRRYRSRVQERRNVARFALQRLRGSRRLSSTAHARDSHVDRVMLSGAYKIPAIQMNIVGVFTNKMATDAYRGAGRPEATYVVERALDLVAADLGMDPRKCVAKTSCCRRVSFHTATGLDYDSGDYEAALNKAQEIAGYADLREKQKKAREEGRLIGIGLSTYVEICALGPSQAMPLVAGKARQCVSSRPARSRC